MTFSYSMTCDDWLEYFEALNPPQNLKDPFRYYWVCFSMSGGWIVVSYLLLVEINQMFFGLMAGIIGIRQLISMAPYSRVWKSSSEDFAKGRKNYEIKLEIREEGLTETAFDIISFCPWSSVVKVVKCKGMIVIYLTSGLHAMIPSRVIESASMSPEQFLTLIESRCPKRAPDIIANA